MQQHNFEKHTIMNDTYSMQVEESVNELFRNIEPRTSVADMEHIREAYQLAAEAHKEQRRKSGEPYIMHPIAVARIVAEELELGAAPIMAAFLHDVVEDTDYTLEDIRSRFGDDVAFLVGVVTKQKKDKYEHSKQVDNFRQILASVQFDIRALLLKLADRMHNMRTLSSMRPDKQMKIAGETDYFYAPLANRLGLYHVKTELENLSFKYRCPREYAFIEEHLKVEQEAQRENLEIFTNQINEALQEENLQARLEIRHRMPYSAWRKMQNAKCDFNHITGKHYIRIIYSTDDYNEEKNSTFSLEEKDITLRIYGALTDKFKERPGSVFNYVNTPKENGYQSFHVKLLNPHGAWEEVHISSERMVRNSRLGCTAERTEGNVKKWIRKFTTVLKDVAYHTHEIEFMDGVTASFYNDDIMVFTPKGKGIVLPKNATALDFAFEIHSEVGEHAIYARINGKLMSLKTVLHRGDCVEIGTNEDSHPDPDWLLHVCSYKAKRELRSYFAQCPHLIHQRCPHCNPLPGDEVIGFRRAGEQLVIHKRNCPTAIRLASHEGDSIVAVNFDEDKAFLYPVRIRIRAIDRYHLLSDLIYCITEQQHLSMTRIVTENIDRIVESTIDFPIHSVPELLSVMDAISAIDGVDEVYRIDIE